MVIGNVSNNDEHRSSLLRKKYKKSPPYRSCSAPSHNVNKPNNGHCCTYPKVWKRLEDRIYNKHICNNIPILWEHFM